MFYILIPFYLSYIRLNKILIVHISLYNILLFHQNYQKFLDIQIQFLFFHFQFHLINLLKSFFVRILLIILIFPLHKNFLFYYS